MAFVDLRDASGFAQVVVRDEADFDPHHNLGEARGVAQVHEGHALSLIHI